MIRVVFRVRVATAGRNYPRATLFYLLGLTYGIGGVLAFVVLPGLLLVERFFHFVAKSLRVPGDLSFMQTVAEFPCNAVTSAGTPTRLDTV